MVMDTKPTSILKPRATTASTTRPAMVTSCGIRCERSLVAATPSPAGSRGPYMPEPKPLKATSVPALAPTLTDIRASAACSTKWPTREDSSARPPRTTKSTTAMTRLKIRLVRNSAVGLKARSVLAMMPLTVTP